MTRIPKANNKYRNRTFTADGQYFHSQAEFNRWNELKLLQRAGEISGLQREVPFVLIPQNGKYRATKYIADFVYLTKDGEKVVEDVKGIETEVFKIKRKLMYSVHGIDIQVIKR